MIKKTFIFLIPLFAIALSLTFAKTVFADDAKNQIIIVRCSELQNTLTETEKRDLVARTNMGREFENTDKQLTAFNKRVSNNNFNNQQFADTLNQYQQAVNQFRVAYVTYDDSMTELLNIDCKKQPNDFYNKLIKTRDLRTAVNSSVQTVDGLLLKYKSLMLELQSKVGGSQ